MTNMFPTIITVLEVDHKVGGWFGLRIPFQGFRMELHPKVQQCKIATLPVETIMYKGMNNIVAVGARVWRVQELEQETFEIKLPTPDLFFFVREEKLEYRNQIIVENY